ncbi:excisionase family DNA-binding protein [Rhizobium sp. EC-SD404]|uniref:excisionase family DNA-binding protein n=1 Tax=Rhizobium sp. EC-SD404 TaxID=2038389 RepID=UPI00125577E4|nr:excisionase family DNA-binding protein [Rhizobium sp. EC-SD404]VVT07963.1 conserved hypothetical protein [Rhizobium sp. EC-SD404]
MAALTVQEGQQGDALTVSLDPPLALVFSRFLSTALKKGGVAYGPLGTELTPVQAGKILGVSRPMVVRRMEDGRLPFHYVGTHRRSTLADVIALKAKEEEQNDLMNEIYQNFDEIGDFEAPHKP